MYCAIIADLIESRKIKDRQGAQIRLSEILKEVNETYCEDISSNFTITIGDEFQGLLSSPERALEIIDRIKLEFHPHKLRFGIGIGQMHTQINKDIAIGSDGPAYHYAREAIDRIKKSSSMYEQPYIDTYMITNNDSEMVNLVNSILSMCSQMDSSWSDKQIQAVKGIQYTQVTQKELADILGVTQSSIQRRLYSAGYFTYKSAKGNAQKGINKVWEEAYADE